MKAASATELKQELSHLDKKELTAITLRLSRFKKENKELLTYLLFESGNESQYVDSVKEEMNNMFEAIPRDHNIYFKLKMIRKILRTTNKFIRYSDVDSTKVDLLIHFCEKVNSTVSDRSKRQALENLYHSTLEKIIKAVGGLHEDLRTDYEQVIRRLVV